MDQYRRARKILRNAIKVSKTRSWEELCKEINDDPWGLPYRIVTKKTGYRKQIPGITHPNWALTIIKTLFPSVKEVPRLPLSSLEGEMEPVTREEIIETCKNLKRNKAPGPGGVPNEIIKITGECWPELFCHIYNKCIQTGTYPIQRKQQKLLLLQKGYKPLENPSSYRPLCLLDTAGKFLERLLVNRLKKSLSQLGGFSPLQFGFINGRSTTDGISEVVMTAIESKVECSQSILLKLLIVT